MESIAKETAGQRGRHGDQIATVRAAELQHAARFRRRGLHAEEPCRQAQTIGMGQEEGMAPVRDFVAT
jgi:hypothetical protein